MVAISFGVLMLMVLSIPQSFMLVKLPFLALVLAAVLIDGLRGRYAINVNALRYFLAFMLLASIWCIVGLFWGNSVVAVIESFRLYFVYIWIYAALVMYLSEQRYHEKIDAIVLSSVVVIFLLAIYSLANHLYKLGWLGGQMEEELLLQAGVHTGYTQLNNVNIGTLTFVLPYLTARFLLAHRRKAVLGLGILLALVAAILASRRMVVLVFLLAPLTTIFVMLGASVRRGAVTRRCVLFYVSLVTVLFVVGAVFRSVGGEDAADGLLERFEDALVADGESPRQLQNKALMDGFEEYWLMGSGFGGLVSEIRSDERPWTFELTYSRLLFNAGIIGCLLLAAHFLYYTRLAFARIANSSDWDIYVPLLVGVFSVLLAAASNPYLGSFDLLFPLAVVPLILSTKERGREEG